MAELFVFWVVKEGQDRDPIINIEGKAEGTVIYYNHVFEVAVANDAQVLDQPVVSLYAVLPVKSRIEDLCIWVDEVQNGVCIRLITGCEADDLIILFQLEEALPETWSDVDVDV